MDTNTEQSDLAADLRDAIDGRYQREIARIQLATRSEAEQLWYKIPHAKSLLVSIYPMRDMEDNAEAALDAAEECWQQTKRDARRKIETLLKDRDEEYAALDEWLSCRAETRDDRGGSLRLRAFA